MTLGVLRVWPTWVSRLVAGLWLAGAAASGGTASVGRDGASRSTAGSGSG